MYVLVFPPFALQHLYCTPYTNPLEHNLNDTYIGLLYDIWLGNLS